MTPLYLFSGLGADERVFQKLVFPGYEPVFIRWIQPKPNESMAQYAGRLLAQIPTRRPILLGLSFGGMMAVEVSKLIDTEKVILIASAKTRLEIPGYYRLTGALGLIRLLPAGLLRWANPLTNWFFDAETDADQLLLKQILHDTDPVFLKWALQRIVSWENDTLPANWAHLHGTRDRLLPCHLVTPTATIPDGGHLMTLNRSDAVNAALQKILNMNAQ